MSNADHLSLLGLSPGASREEVKKSYRTKAKTCHPDLFPGRAVEFRALTAAYNALINPTGMSEKRVRAPDAPHNPFSEFDRHARR